jgi:hypothetical protein
MAETVKKQPPVPVPPSVKKPGQGAPLAYVPVQHQEAAETPAEVVEHLALPGNPPQVIARVWADLSALERDAFYPHLIGHTSAEWLADTLTGSGYKISATSIRTYRRSLGSE